MASTDAAGHPSPDSEQPAQSQRNFIIYLLSFAVLAAIVLAAWFGFRWRQNAAAMAAAQVAADSLRKQNVLITGSPADTANLTNRPMNADFVRDVSQLVTLKTLNLARTGTTDAQLAEILPKLNLVSLVLNETDVTDQGLPAIRHMNKLETLILPGTEIGNAGLGVIGKMKRITELNLGHTQITDDGITELAGLSGLVRLILDGTKITDEGLVNVAAIPNLLILEAHETSLTPEGIRNLRKLKPGINVKR